MRADPADMGPEATDHLQAVAGPGGQVAVAQSLEFIAGRFVESDVDHTVIVYKPRPAA
jgi:hypothetical protein